MVADDAEVALATPDHPYVGRGGLKLAHALDVFAIDPRDCVALDVGASTGGFTDVLLRRGATRVVALDVGHNQLAWSLRTDPRVVVLEKVNARTLTADQLGPDAPHVFDLITIDVSFISLRLVLPPLVPLLRPGGRIVALVKPQFEAGREDVGAGGIVRDPGRPRARRHRGRRRGGPAGPVAPRDDALADRRRRRQPRVPGVVRACRVRRVRRRRVTPRSAPAIS